MKQLLKCFLFLLLAIYYGSPLYAKLQGQAPPLTGQARIDSLLRELPKQKEDTNKVNLLVALTFANRMSNQDEGKRYGQQAGELSAKLNWKRGIAAAKAALGTVYLENLNYPNALECLFSALKLQEEINDKSGTGLTTNKIGIVYFNQQNYPKALDYFFRAMKISEETGNVIGVLNTTGNVGNIHMSLGDPAGAL